MSTDISLYVERRTAEGTWELVIGDHPYGYEFALVSRCYDLFARLGHPRRHTDHPIGRPRRGLPVDATGTVREQHRRADAGFSAVCTSWVTLAELNSAAPSIDHEYGDFLNEVLAPMRALGAPDDVRAVFWFDQ
jgi:hypothetical protein